jgi:hypothetical protein
MLKPLLCLIFFKKILKYSDLALNFLINPRKPHFFFLHHKKVKKFHAKMKNSLKNSQQFCNRGLGGSMWRNLCENNF